MSKRSLKPLSCDDVVGNMLGFAADCKMQQRSLVDSSIHLLARDGRDVYIYLEVQIGNTLVSVSKDRIEQSVVCHASGIEQSVTRMLVTDAAVLKTTLICWFDGPNRI